MDPLIYVKAFFALAFVLSLIIALNFILKHTKTKSLFQNNNSNKRLKLLETLHIDTRNKIVLIKRDNIEHLVLLNATRNDIIEKNISLNQSDD